MTESTKLFAELLARAHPNVPTNIPLTNVTFFLGAGFSKSWDSRFPVGDALFSFSYKEWHKHGGPLEEFLALNNYPPFNLDLSASLFKDIVYQIGMMRKYPEMRPRYIDDQNLDMVEKHLRYLVRKKFEDTAPMYFEANEKLHIPGQLTMEQRAIQRLFRTLGRAGDGSEGLPRGLRANFLTTNYDFVLEAILDSVLAPDDTYSLYTYRGITPIKYSGKPPRIVVHENWLVGNLLKINGGFEVFKSADGFEVDYRNQKSDAELRLNPPQLMLASREQDYTQSYFRAMFPKVIRLLHETSYLVVVGYSLPEEDALLRLIIRQFAEDRTDGNEKALFYVDLSNSDAQVSKVKSVFPHVGDIGLTVIPYSGSFASWCDAVVEKHTKLVK
ncbi:hypothetical protein [Variovorax ginsengisoli]|uniref:SIR2-like domain-containing protein n=1 Tax=Variovorax ginsengisoli TaxID=363844 RepID=A0ABT8S0Q5_9BURK|nr:hypothetical protein [Variovorax ginsengisoli]MDN8612407.1 hypothetical protein [Variovorax ginsengisoli]MDO1531577.1 hypothetical protein [Variovorax ginsengisoli]